jgi:hypothetical protein
MGINYFCCAIDYIRHRAEHIFLRGNYNGDLHDPLPHPNHEGTHRVCQVQSVLSDRKSHARSSIHLDCSQQNQGPATK